MSELEALTLTIVYTLIVVTMATLFLCCWRKKDAVSVTDGKANKVKTSSIKGSKKDKPEAVVHATENKSGNGASVPTPSSSPKLTADLGDFSVVQRETEILKSYRKAAPPKNRARQRRAPRALNRSTENLDIFTELSEDELKSQDETDDITTHHTNTVTFSEPQDQIELGNHNNSGSDHNNSGSDHNNSGSDHNNSGSDEKETVTLRTSVIVNSAKRETRSSMLADIEKTLARLHSSNESSSLDNTVSDHGNETQKEKATSGNSSPFTDHRETLSVDSSPSSKPKVGPRVSPKPAPRKRVANNKIDEPKSEQTQDSHLLTNSSDSDQTADMVDSVAQDVMISTGVMENFSPTSDVVLKEYKVNSVNKTPEAQTVASEEPSLASIENKSSPEAENTRLPVDSNCPEIENINLKTSSLVVQLCKPSQEVISPSDSVASDQSKVLKNEQQCNSEVSNLSHDEGTEEIQEHSTEEHKNLPVEGNKSEIVPTEQEQTVQLDIINEEKSEENSETSEDQLSKSKQSKIPVRAGSKSGLSSPQEKTPTK